MEIVIETTHGKAVGVKEDTYYAYKGIPFAKAPVGELRFKPPVELDKWEGVRIFDKYGNIEPRPVSSIRWCCWRKFR